MSYPYCETNYANNEFLKLKSKRECKKFMAIFGVEEIEALKKVLSKNINTSISYRRAFKACPIITQIVSLDEIATL